MAQESESVRLSCRQAVGPERRFLAGTVGTMRQENADVARSGRATDRFHCNSRL